MKPFRKITVLLAVIVSMLAFWVVPQINEGKELAYVRYYEDTDVLPAYNLAVNNNNKVLSGSDTTKKEKRYKKEVIRPRRQKEVNAKMFSRAIQYEPVIEEDTVAIVEVVEVESKVVQ